MISRLCFIMKVAYISRRQHRLLLLGVFFCALVVTHLYVKDNTTGSANNTALIKLLYTRDFGLQCNSSKTNSSYDDGHSRESWTSSSRWLDYRDQFLMWESFNRPDIGDDTRTGGPRYFIYRCDLGTMNSCGGWADRLKGAMVGYVLANLTGRIFKAEFLKPDCDLNRYITPNEYNWSLPISISPKQEEFNIVRLIDEERFKNFSKANFTQMFDPKVKYIYYLSNLDHLSGLQMSRIYSDRLSWMRTLTPADIYAAVYKRLFKLAPRQQSRLREIISETLPTKRHRLICIHVRMGTNPTNNEDVQVRNSFVNLHKIWSFVANHSRTEYDKVFVMSDSDEVILSARKQCFSDRLLTVPGSIVHVDHVARKSREEMCDGFEKLLLEHHLLMTCDVLIRGHSGLSVIASAVRGSDDDLYCLQASGDIIPCKRNDFIPAFM